MAPDPFNDPAIEAQILGDVARIERNAEPLLASGAAFRVVS
jgi:hypothetical protein